MKLILDIDVKISGSYELIGNLSDIVMIPFGGTAGGPYFSGSIIGCGVDTQKREKNGPTRLSARYMIDGTDYTGAQCRVFIENNSNADGGFTPVITTDSKALANWEQSELTSEIIPADSGVNVKIYIKDGNE